MAQDTRQSYSVTVESSSASQALAVARGYSLNLNIKKGGSEGFNAAETLLAALGTCILTNVASLSQKMRIEIQGAWVELNAERSDDPPGLVGIDYRLVLRSRAERDKLEQLHNSAIKWGTVTNTLARGVIVQGRLVIESGTYQ